jgi:hypothetical protein
VIVTACRPLTAYPERFQQIEIAELARAAAPEEVSS